MIRLRPTFNVLLIVTGLLISSWQSIAVAADLFQLVDQDVAVCIHVRQFDTQGRSFVNLNSALD